MKMDEYQAWAYAVNTTFAVCESCDDISVTPLLNGDFQLFLECEADRPSNQEVAQRLARSFCRVFGGHSDIPVMMQDMDGNVYFATHIYMDAK